MPSPAQPPAALTPLRITTFRPYDDPAIRFAVKIQTEAYRRLGYAVEMLYVPGKRASDMAQSGMADGELARPGGYDEDESSMVRVDEPCAMPLIMAYTVDPELRLDGWKSLLGTNLRVEYQRGMSSTARALHEVVAPERLSEVDFTEQGLKRLLVGRIDLYVDASLGTGEVLASAEFQAFQEQYANGVKVRAAGVMGGISLYPWLNRKHADLAPRLAEVLREMKADGTFERFAQDFGGSRELFRW